MIVRLSLYGLIFFSFLKGSPLSDLDSLKIGLQFFRWKKIDVELNQFQYGQIYNSNLSVFFIDSTDYLIESKEQDIFFQETISKLLTKTLNSLS